MKNSNTLPNDFFNENTELSDEDKKKAASWYPIPRIPGLPAPTSPQPQIPGPPTLTGGGVLSSDTEKDAPTAISKCNINLIIETERMERIATNYVNLTEFLLLDDKLSCTPFSFIACMGM